MTDWEEPTALVVGNGFTIARRTFAGAALAQWDTQHPLNWRVETPGRPGVPFLDSLPRLTNAVNVLRAEGETDDFALFDSILGSPERYEDGDFERAFLKEEAHHFLAIAFSTFQLASEAHEVDDWDWTDFLKALKDNLVVAVSFNYDLILGPASSQARCGLRSER